jgi:hypothetical protein
MVDILDGMVFGTFTVGTLAFGMLSVGSVDVVPPNRIKTPENCSDMACSQKPSFKPF